MLRIIMAYVYFLKIVCNYMTYILLKVLPLYQYVGKYYSIPKKDYPYERKTPDITKFTFEYKKAFNQKYAEITCMWM